MTVCTLWSGTESECSEEHRQLLSQELPVAVAHVAAMWRIERLHPWELMLYLLDLRGLFGLNAATCFIDVGMVSGSVARSLAQGMLPGLTLPLPLESGMTLVQEYIPDFADPIVSRAPKTTPVVIMDRRDEPVLAFVSDFEPDERLS